MINNIFYNNRIQWAAVAAIVSFVGIVATVLSTWYINNKTIKANISSKTRIEWINQIRQLSADLISNYELLINFSMSMYGDEIKYASKGGIHFTNTDNAQKYNEHLLKIKSLSNQLLLYFVNDNEHKEIKKLINELNQITIQLADYSREQIEKGESAEYYSGKVHAYKEITEELTNEVTLFREMISKYLDTEWRKVESGKNKKTKLNLKRL